MNDFPPSTTYSSLTDVQKKLLDAASEARKNAYSPYSHFQVGCAILTKDGTTITGSNVENAAYSPTLCAERAAILAANAQGHRTFTTIAVIGGLEKGESADICAPCGACRQVIVEFAQLAGIDIEIIMSNSTKDTIQIATIATLLPFPFGPQDVGVDIQAYRK